MRAIVTTIMEATGLVFTAAGVWVLFGAGAGLVAAGVSLVAVGVAEGRT